MVTINENALALAVCGPAFLMGLLTMAVVIVNRRLPEEEWPFMIGFLWLIVMVVLASVSIGALVAGFKAGVS